MIEIFGHIIMNFFKDFLVLSKATLKIELFEKIQLIIQFYKKLKSEYFITNKINSNNK